MLQTGSNLGTGNAAVAKDAADEAATHPHINPLKEVCSNDALMPAALLACIYSLTIHNTAMHVQNHRLDCILQCLPVSCRYFRKACSIQGGMASIMCVAAYIFWCLPIAGKPNRFQVEKKMDDHWAMFHSLHALQYGPGQHEHCYSTNGRTVWLGLCHHRHCPIFLLLVRVQCHHYRNVSPNSALLRRGLSNLVVLCVHGMTL